MDSINGQLVACNPFLLLSSPKRDYQKNEQVIIVVTLANFTQSALVVNKRLQMIFDYKYREAYELQFQIIRPDGMPLAPRFITEDRLCPYPGPEDFAELLPARQWKQEIRLDRYFNFSEKGLYLISAEYHNDHDGHQFGVDAWTGKLRSSSIEVIIKG
jgi:hypothetical protein